MPEWLESIAGRDYAVAVVWTAGALVLLVVVLLFVRLIRGMTFGTFVSGGRNRKTRLAVMDATAVDSHRRLVLIRRDDVEHLILIGGPTDVVVEQNIRIGQPRRPALTGEHQQEAAARQQRPAEQPRPQQPRPAAPAPATMNQPQTVSREYRPATPSHPEAARQRPAPQPAPVAAPQRMVAPAPSHHASNAQDSFVRRETEKHAAPAQNIGDDIDRALLAELSTSFDTPAQPATKEQAASLEDEMNKLLGELSHRNR